MHLHDVLIGRFGKSHGVKGFVVVHSYTEKDVDIMNYQPWLIGDKKKAEVDEYRKHHKKIIVRLKGITTPEEAKKLTNLNIYVPKTQLPEIEDDKNYWHDMIGLTVENHEGFVVGKLSDIQKTGTLPMMIIHTIDGETLSMPFIRGKTVLKVSLQEEKMTIKWNKS